MWIAKRAAIKKNRWKVPEPYAELRIWILKCLFMHWIELNWILMNVFFSDCIYFTFPHSCWGFCGQSILSTEGSEIHVFKHKKTTSEWCFGAFVCFILILKISVCIKIVVFSRDSAFLWFFWDLLSKFFILLKKAV